MAKKTVKDISTILTSDIQHNINMLGLDLRPLALASTHALANRFKLGKDILNSPQTITKEQSSHVRSLITQLYANRVDYTDIVSLLNKNNTHEQISSIRGGKESPLNTGVLARMIGYDLFMLTAMFSLYPTQVGDIKETWKDINKGNYNLCKSLIASYAKQPGIQESLYGGNKIPNFTVPVFLKS